MKRSLILLIIPLVITSFTHLWNPIGFPDLFSDEGVYIRRSLHILQGLGPQETDTYYDNPFFGQIFLAAIFSLIGYPDSMGLSSDLHSSEMLFAVPRILMGVLAVIDTYLLFKITERQYNKNLAFFASILFAVMPMSWFTRRILLESIQLPFLLSSILFALYSSKSITVLIGTNKVVSFNVILVLISGILLGISIFTKIPAFVMIPLIGFLIFRYSNKSWKIMGLWFIPVVLIPIIWPTYSIAVGQFDYWWDTIKVQTVREGVPLLNTIPVLLLIDPVLLILGAAGIILAIIKKDLFILLWGIPYFIFLVIVGWNWAPYQLFIPLIPLFCIASSTLIFDIAKRIKTKNIQKVLPWSVITVLSVFGLISTTMLISMNVTSGQFQMIKFVSSYVNDISNNESIMIVSNPIYSWIFKYVYHKDNVLNEVNDFDYEPVTTKKILFISDVESKSITPYSESLQELYNTTKQIFKINGLTDIFDTTRYPYSSMLENYESMDETEVRVCTLKCMH
jgi:hypothetical protein